MRKTFVQTQDHTVLYAAVFIAFIAIGLSIGGLSNSSSKTGFKASTNYESSTSEQKSTLAISCTNKSLE